MKALLISDSPMDLRLAHFPQFTVLLQSQLHNLTGKEFPGKSPFRIRGQHSPFQALRFACRDFCSSVSKGDSL
ncbi:hypothetical protein TIFTF001_011109 [Ficus carica]|uniref:Uncharacterized protein n=1 Tax=Ficus carica TaxID=3494 RepID=A0AA87ZY33_FICCA|nr:hypothetical protein TIFTF001_011109 [Ficus carica]